MWWRMAGLVPVAMIVRWSSWSMVRPDKDNWILWFLYETTSPVWSMAWGLIMFAFTVVILGSIALFAKKSLVGFLAVVALAFCFSWLIAMSMRHSSGAVHPYYFATLMLGMVSSFPLMFSQLIGGKFEKADKDA